MYCMILAGRPKVIKRVTWRKDLNNLPTSGRYKISDNGKVVTISSLSHTLHDGNYSCAATNDVGMGKFGVKFNLLVKCKCAPILSEMSMNVTLTDLVLYVMPTGCIYLCSRANETQHKYYNKDGPLSDKEIYFVILVRTVYNEWKLYFRVYKKCTNSKCSI